MNAVKVIFRKEMVDGLRDRRSLFSALLFPVLGPALMIFIYNMAAEKVRMPEKLELPVIGSEYAPTLIDWMEQKDVELVEGPEDPHAAVRNREVDLVLVISEDFGEDFARGRTAEVELVIDSSNDDAGPKERRVRRVIGAYEKLIANLRLVARGISPEVVNPIEIEEVEIASSQKLSARILRFIPMYVILAAFIAGMNIAIDATAGERERGSLESLLVNPVTRTAIVLGKWLAAVVFACFGVVLTLGSCLIGLEQMTLRDMGMRFDFGVSEAIGILAATLPLSFLAAGLQVLVATFARSYKEAQMYMSMLMFLPIVPGIAFTIHSISSEGWMYPIPILGQQALLTDVLSGEAPGLVFFILAGLSSLMAGLLCVGLTAKLFQREGIIFGR